MNESKRFKVTGCKGVDCEFQKKTSDVYHFASTDKFVQVEQTPNCSKLVTLNIPRQKSSHMN